jgi:hypothetical protein
MCPLSAVVLYIKVKIKWTIQLKGKMKLSFIDSDLLYRGTL